MYEIEVNASGYDPIEALKKLLHALDFDVGGLGSQLLDVALDGSSLSVGSAAPVA